MCLPLTTEAHAAGLLIKATPSPFSSQMSINIVFGTAFHRYEHAVFFTC